MSSNFALGAISLNSVAKVYSKTETEFKKLMEQCEVYVEEFNEIVQDEQDIILEIEDCYGDIRDLEKSFEDEFYLLLAEIEELEKKEALGTITKEERAELAAKRGEVANLQSNFNNDVKNKNSIINAYGTQVENLNQSAEKAQDHANLTIDTGKSYYDEKFDVEKQEAKRLSDIKKGVAGETAGIAVNRKTANAIKSMQNLTKLSKEAMDCGNNLLDIVNNSLILKDKIMNS